MVWIRPKREMREALKTMLKQHLDAAAIQDVEALPDEAMSRVGSPTLLAARAYSCC
jgi:hypothetical protein